MESLLPGLSTFFFWLMDYTIDISILICLIFIIKSIVSKKLPAWWHYSLWIILLLRMIIPWEFENPLNIPNVVPVSLGESLFESVLIEEEFIISELTTELSSNPQGWHVQVDEVLLFLWLTCAIIFGMYILVKNIKFWNAIKKEPLLTDKKVLSLLEECKNRMESRAPLKITVTDKVKSPALFGYIRPRLLLPVGVLEKLGNAELSYIFMHELGHLKRHDIGVSWVITFLHIFQWFNPFVWLAFYQMRVDQESACDASVLSRIKGNQSIDYASTIVGFLEKFCRNRKLPALVGILENQTQIKKRITMIINYRKYSKMMMFFSNTLLIIIGVIFFSLAGAKENHERPGLDSSILPTLLFEVQKDLATQDNDVKYEKEAVRLAEAIQKAPVVAQDIDAKDAVAREKLNQKTQKAMIAVQDNDIKDEKKVVRLPETTQRASVVDQDMGVKNEIEQAKQNLQTQKALVAVQDNNIKDEKEVVRLVERTQKTPAEALKIFKEVYNISSEKRYNASEEKSLQYLGLASVAYYKSGNPDDPKGTPDPPENESNDGKIYNLKGVDEHPKIVSFFPPRYPFSAKAKGIEGRVYLRFIVDSEGYVQDPQVVSAEPEGIFEQAALDTVIKYRLKPAMKDGKCVSSVAKLAISFAIKDNYLRFAQR